MATLKPYPFLLVFIVLFCFVRPTLAFGAGNIAGISKVEGQNWRHGDIEDALLKIIMARAAGGKRFDKLMVSRVYFGNWLRDYSQAIDVGTVKSVSAEAIRLLLCVLGFLTFGYGSREFEVTADRLGCYRPEDHIDNPKSYADNQDARQYDRRLRGPVDESVELAIDEETGMKNYIANENAGIMTSALHVRRLFTKCIELGRSYGRSGRKEELYEALRLMGTGLHCLEDYFAHSNYTELALIELGEREIFPHVGRNTMLRIPGARREVYPIVTGTFGGVDFLHSVTGELSDKMIQSEIEDLEGTLQQSQNNDTSLLRDLLDKIPDGLLGDNSKKSKIDDIQSNAQAAQMENVTVSPREPEEFTAYVSNIFRQVMPAIEFHDQLLQDISKAIEKIPVLPKIIEQLEEQLSVFVFQVIAPFVIPVIEQVKNELATGATEIIESSKNEQHNIFDDDYASDPTHSMLSKDHFTNILNEIAGRTASKVVSWTVPQLMDAWDDDNVDVDRMLNKIIYGVLHHPAQRTMGPEGAEEGRSMIFESVREWWEDMDERQRDEYRGKLSRDGVERGENHKEGQDCGHGCGGKLKMRKNYKNEAPETLEDRIAGAAADAIMGGVKQGLSEAVQGGGGGGFGREESEGGLGGLLKGVAGGLLSGFKKDETESYQSGGRTEDGGYTQTTTEYGHSGDRYGQAQYSETQYGDGGSRSEYRRYEQHEDDSGRGESYGYEQRTETRYGGGYGGEEERSSYGRREEQSYGGGGARDDYIRSSEQSYGGGGYGRREEESGYGRREEGEGYGGGGYGGGYGRREEESSYSSGGYGRREEGEGYGGGYGRRDDEDRGYGRRDEEESGYGHRGEGRGYGGGYGRREEEDRGYGKSRHRKDKDSDSDSDKRKGGGRRKNEDSDSDSGKKKKSGHRHKDDDSGSDSEKKKKKSGHRKDDDSDSESGKKKKGGHRHKDDHSDSDSGKKKKKGGHHRKDSDDDKHRERRGYGYGY